MITTANATNEIASKMNINVNTQYEKIKVTDFKGVYASQVPIKTQNDLPAKEILEKENV